jgi:hypothetical protein
VYGAIIGLLQPSIGRDAYRIAILSLLVLMVVGFLIVRRVPERREPEPDVELPLARPLEPAIVPPGEAP